MTTKRRSTLGRAADTVAGFGRPQERQPAGETPPATAPAQEGPQPFPPPAPATEPPVEELLAPGETPPGEYWRRISSPMRVEQLEQLDDLLTDWAKSRRVRISMAEAMRLALDRLITEMERDPDAIIRALYDQEQREEREAPSRKFARSRGAREYLKKKGLL
jgi:hypothetical protein